MKTTRTNEGRPVARCGMVVSHYWVSALCLVALTPARAADGDLDLTFGRNGTAALPYFSASIRFYPPLAMALQPDGKIMVAGSTESPSSPGDFQVVRHNGDGS